SFGINEGSGDKRSARWRMSIQRWIGFSSAKATIGALRSPPHATMSSFGAPAIHGPATYSSPLTSKIVFAAWPQGLGNPWTSTMRKPLWEMTSLKLEYRNIGPSLSSLLYGRLRRRSGNAVGTGSRLLLGT